MQETHVESLDQEDTLEKEMAIHSSILSWRIPWTEEPGMLQSRGHKELDTTEQLLLTQTWSRVQNNVRHFTGAQQVIVDFSRSHLINAF